jgi:selenocysteine lyase/cysteine desulfurase
MTTRRDFLRTAGLGVAALPAAHALAACGAVGPTPTAPAAATAGFPAPGDWPGVRELFALRRDRIHLAGLLFVSHPRPVRDEIERLRKAYDEDPVAALHATLEQGMDDTVRAAIVGYTGGTVEQVALTDSTTMGLGIVYGGLRLGAGDEVLTTTHDHYSTHEALRVASARAGFAVRQVPLYERPAEADADKMVAALAAAIAPATRIVAVTWVHSSTGVCLPIRALADVVAKANAGRAPEARILLVVDGVHGFGSRPESVSDLGCDVFVAGCHKWMFGPRGTGMIWATPEAWDRIAHSIPPFEAASHMAWIGKGPNPAQMAPARWATPGGFHSFEHRYALPVAFALHAALGRPAVAARIAALNTRLKRGLAAIPGLTLHTPIAPALSAGLVCFELARVDPEAIVARLAERGITASHTPYVRTYARLTPGLWNDEAEVDRAIAAVRGLA